jgi:Zn-dependent M28 family amino/carboxypeptidase
MQLRKITTLLFAGILMAGCNTHEKQLNTAIKSINADDMKNYISMLASDDFLGRAPATLGEERTINYLADQFRKAGLQPADSGSYFQKVSLVRITADPDMVLKISGGRKTVDLKYSDDFIGDTPQVSKDIDISNSDIVFVGYGINSPENNWDDYSGIDVKGKTVMMLVNDPGYATADSSLFDGKAMTYYGRWTYKYEEAARQGARAAIIIHETGAAAYPWEVVQNSFSGAKFYLTDDPLSRSDLQMQSWITTDAAKKVFEAAGLDYERVITSAARPGFKAIDLKLKASVNFKNDIAYTESNNVAGLLPGSDHADEYIIYTAHWDHFGVNPSFKGDSILNGAVDNATGTAALIEIAKAFASLPVKQDRSILFLAVTCEEQGLLGSQYYAEHPLFPLNKTVAEINMDGLNILGKTRDMTITGFGNSDLDKYAVNVLEKYDRYATPDPTPEKGGYFRSDHFSFAKVGVPSLALSKGVDDVEHGKKWGLEQSEAWTMTNYHKPSDNYEPDKWNFDGMIEDIRVYFEIGYDISISRDFPNWTKGSPFRAMRDKMMMSN